MPRQRAPEMITIEFRDPPPKGSTSGGRWLETLTPLLKTKGRWAMVKVYDNPDQANDARGNLTQRNVRIPEPTHDWSFAARGCELFAIYRGPMASKGQKGRTRK